MRDALFRRSVPAGEVRPGDLAEVSTPRGGTALVRVEAVQIELTEVVLVGQPLTRTSGRRQAARFGHDQTVDVIADAATTDSLLDAIASQASGNWSKEEDGVVFRSVDGWKLTLQWCVGLPEHRALPELQDSGG